MPYTPPLSNAVNFDGTATAYTPPLSNAVNFDDWATLDLSGSGIASAEAFGSLTLTVQVSGTGIASAEALGSLDAVALIGAGSVASEEAFGAPDVVFVSEISCIGIASEEAFGLLTLTAAAAPVEVVDETPIPVGGTYASVRQRTEAYAMRADAQGQNIRISQRITAKPEMVVEQINERDRLDLLDIFTVFRETRKAA